MLRARFQGENVDLLAAASRDGAVAVWRISEAEGGLRSEALLSLLLRDAAGERSAFRRLLLLCAHGKAQSENVCVRVLLQKQVLQELCCTQHLPAHPANPKRESSNVQRSACQCYSNLAILLLGTQGLRCSVCLLACQVPSGRIFYRSLIVRVLRQAQLVQHHPHGVSNVDVRRRAPRRRAPGLAPGAAGRAGGGGGDARAPGRAGRPGAAHQRPGERGARCSIVLSQAGVCLCCGFMQGIPCDCESLHEHDLLAASAYPCVQALFRFNRQHEQSMVAYLAGMRVHRTHALHAAYQVVCDTDALPGGEHYVCH